VEELANDQENQATYDKEFLRKALTLAEDAISSVKTIVAVFSKGKFEANARYVRREKSLKSRLNGFEGVAEFAKGQENHEMHSIKKSKTRCRHAPMIKLNVSHTRDP
jgi:hypothetical protein